eukprot:NODE_17_length_48642_cov_1.199349.p8 type:complete len:437 gc:universal NODE_17_length_48642_cov_1.199349:8497-9807(+)
MDSDEDFYFSDPDSQFANDEGFANSPPMDQEKEHKTLDTYLPYSSISYQICKSIQPLLQQSTSTVSQVLNISEDYAAMLLLQKKFKTEDLIQEAVGGEMLKALTITNKRSSRNNSKICNICYINDVVITLSCSHYACVDCIKHFIKSGLNENTIEKLTCLEMNCDYFMTRSFIKEVDELLIPKYDQQYSNKFIDASLQLKYCVKCNAIIQINTSLNLYTQSSIIPIVTCDNCSTQFCFSCSKGNHLPIPCSQLKRWQKKCMDDSETANWIHANTKECSKCNSTIEKNGGCNHMVCKRCTYEFCWVCMGPWSEHGTQWYNCSRFEENSSLEARDNQAKSRAALERYLFYFNRYANHEQSLKLDKELYLKTELKMEEMQKQSNLSWIDVQYMKTAVDILGKSRTILKYNYFNLDLHMRWPIISPNRIKHIYLRTIKET